MDGAREYEDDNDLGLTIFLLENCNNGNLIKNILDCNASFKVER